METNSQKVIALATLVALPFALGAFLLAWAPAAQYGLTDPRGDGYVQPRSIQTIVEQAQDSTVTLDCELPDGGGSFGSAWAADLPNKYQQNYPTTLITNYHVIDDCLDNKGKLIVYTFNGDEYPALVDLLDKENDLATVATRANLKPLQFSQYEPWPGYWVAAVGTADGYEGSVAFGNVLNGTDIEIFTTVPLSQGNSGGPLIDNEGNVVGVNSWESTTEQYNGAMSLNAMCKVIIKCDGEFYWERDN
jgi:S1-C subfamily serine protease